MGQVHHVLCAMPRWDPLKQSSGSPRGLCPPGPHPGYITLNLRPDTATPQAGCPDPDSNTHQARVAAATGREQLSGQETACVARGGAAPWV